MALTPSKLTLQIKSQGIKQAADDLKSLAEAAKSVDAETRSFVIAQAKLVDSGQKVTKSSEATARGISALELQIIKAHEQANKMAAVMDKQAAAQQRVADGVFAKALKDQEAAASKAADAIARQNKELDKQSEALKNTTRHGNIFNNTLKSMAVAASAYTGVNFAKGLFESADAWSMMQSKLSLATGGMQSAKVVQEELYQTAQRIRIPLEDTAKLYNRLVHPLMMMGKSSKETTEMVSSMGYALKLSGATGQEAASAMLQFSQSMNAGRLNGGEFNSIAEASPNILRAIEAELVRTGRGAELASRGLKKMAADGQLTAKLVSEAMLRALPQWKKDFESLPLTVDGAIIRIKNMWEKSIGTLAQDTGFAQNFTKVLNELETVIPAFAKTVVGALSTAIEYSGLFLKSMAAIAAVGIANWAYTAFMSVQGLTAGMKAATIYTNALAGSMALLQSSMLWFAGAAVGIALIVKGYQELNKERAGLGEVTDNLENSHKKYIGELEAETSMLIKQVNLMREKRGESSRLIDPYAKSAAVQSEEKLGDLLKQKLDVQKRLADTEKEIASLQKSIGTGSEATEIARMNRLTKLQGITKEARDSLSRVTALELEQKGKKAFADFAADKAAKEAAIARTKEAEDRLNQLTQHKEKAIDIFNQTKKFADQELLAGNISKQFYDEKIKAAEKLRDANTKEGKATIKALNEEQESIKNLNVELKSLLRQKELLIKLGVDGDKILPERKKLLEMQSDGSSDAQKALQEKKAIAAEEIKSIEDKYAMIRKIREDDERRTSGMSEQNDSMRQQLEILNRQITAGETLKQSKADQNVLEAESELRQLNINGEMGLSIALAQEKVRLAKAIANSTTKLDSLKSSKDLMDSLFDTTKVDTWESSISKGLKGLTKGFADLGKALDKYDAKQSTISKHRENYDKKAVDGVTTEIELSKYKSQIDQKEADYKIASYADIADAAKGFFSENSRGYKAMDAMSKVLHAAQLARDLQATASGVMAGAAKMFGQSGWGGFAGIAAMGAVMVGLGYATGAFGSSGGGGATSAEVQKTQGTGTVLGDSEAKSDSFAKALESMRKNFDKLYPVNVGMLNALKNIEKSMTGLTNIVYRTGITTDTMGIQQGTISKGSKLTDSLSNIPLPVTAILGGWIGVLGSKIAGLIGSLWGKTTQNIVDSGLSLGGSLSGLKQGQGINQYASVDVTKSSWFGLKKTTTNQVQQQAVSNDISSQIGMIFSGMQTALEEAGKALFGKSDDVTKALEALTLSTTKISLKGLTGQALSDALNAVISKGLDEMAGSAFKDFTKYQQVGEGLAATVLRVADNFANVNSIMSKMNLTIFQMSMSGIDASLKLSELMGGLEELKSAASSYYENFFTEEERNAKTMEALKEQFKAMNQELPTSIKAYRLLLEELSKTGDTEKVAQMLKLSDAFAALYKNSADSLDPLSAAKDAFEKISKDAERWLNIRSQAASLKDSIDSTLGNPKKDPAARIKKLWDAMSSDVSPEQKLTLANELKDLIIDKYQVEKESIQKLIDFGKQLRGYTDSLKLGNLSPLTTTQKLAEAQKQFQDTLNKAMGGDSTAQQALTGKADAYLQLAQTAYASSGAYTSIFENVTGALDALGLSSMSAEDKTLSLAQTQADELLKLRDYAAKMETLSDSYYKTNLSLLAEQTSALSKLYDKMGVFDGIATNLAALPAEIAANLSEIMGGNSSGDYITSLYNSLAGKSGDMIDKQGYDYWTNELNVYGKDWVNRSFLESVKVVTGGGVAGIQPRTDNVEVVAQLAAVKEELVALRTEAAKQTGDLIVATYDANSVNAATVVEGTTQSLQESVWAANTTPSLI